MLKNDAKLYVKLTAVVLYKKSHTQCTHMCACSHTLFGKD